MDQGSTSLSLDENYLRGKWPQMTSRCADAALHSWLFRIAECPDARQKSGQNMRALCV